MIALRSLRAIVWLRWRLLANSLMRGGRRDPLEQMSRALALVVPFVVLALSTGTLVGVSIVSFVGGRMMAGNLLAWASGLLVVRLLVGLMAFLIVSLSVISPAQSAVSRYTRLLLLPIPRRVLHLVEVAASLADPWVVVMSVGVTMFAAGMYAGGRADAGLASVAAGGLAVVAVVCLSSLASFLVAWLMRDRRRGELVTLVFVVGFSLMSFVPAFMSRSIETQALDAVSGEPARRGINVETFDRRLPRWTTSLPSEIHGRAVLAALQGDGRTVAASLAMLAGEVVVVFLVSGRVHRRMLNSLEGDRTRRRSSVVALMGRPIPLLSPAASAVAWAFVRGALRSVRGRLAILLPGPLLAMLTAVFQRVPRETWTAEAASRGYLLLGGSLFFTFYTLHAISMNLFGSDRAGLTRQLLVPLSDRDLARGKLAGFAAVVAMGGLICLASAAVVAHTGALAYWLAVMLGAAAIFFLVSPVSIWCSALFPVASDLSKTGAAGNPHPFALIAGTVATAAFAVPTILILALAEFWLKSPAAALAMSAIWLVVAAAMGLPLSTVAARAIGARRENLALVAQGK